MYLVITIKNSVEKKKKALKIIYKSIYSIAMHMNVCFWDDLFDIYITCYFNVIFANKSKGGNDNISSIKPLNDKSLRNK